MYSLRLISVVVALAGLGAVGSTQARVDPFAFLAPTVTVTPREQQVLAQGEALIKVLPAETREIAVAALVPTKADADRLVTWVRQIEQLKKSPAVLAIGRFSNPPVLADLSSLTVSDEDLAAIRVCRPNSCDVKLTAAEIKQLQQEAGAGADWKPRLTESFRRVVLRRVETYIAGGHAALSDYSDGSMVRSLQATISGFLKRSPYLTQKLPRFTEFLERYPQPAPPELQSFFYWSTERISGKPATVAVHVNIWRDPAGDRQVVVAGKQIMATHYMNGSLNIMTILPATAGGPNYFVTLNRSEVDVLSGVFGGIARMIAERRVRSEAAELLQQVRQRLESGVPTASAGKSRQVLDQ